MKCVMMNCTYDVQLAWLFLSHRYSFLLLNPASFATDKACVIQGLLISLLLLKCRATALDSAVNRNVFSECIRCSQKEY